jgi:hypothetical protein
MTKPAMTPGRLPHEEVGERPAGVMLDSTEHFADYRASDRRPLAGDLGCFRQGRARYGDVGRGGSRVPMSEE